MREIVNLLFWVLLPINAILLGFGFWIIDAEDDRASDIGMIMTLLGFILFGIQTAFAILLLITIGS